MAMRVITASRSPQPRPQQTGFKRLIVACDGTWLNSDNGEANGSLSIPSNVTRITRAIKSISGEGIPQIVYYQYGVGGRGNSVQRAVDGAIGEGVGDNIREGYSFICNNYSPGDEIFLIGFSRGAFTARCIAGLISVVGVLTKTGLRSLVEIFRDIRHRRDPDYRPRNPDVPFPNKPSAQDPFYAEELERRGLTNLDATIKAIGVWDTVGALGVPRIGLLTRVGIQHPESHEMQFYDTRLSNCIEHAFQALSLDERRGAFSPALWEKPPNNRTVLRQVWFPGVHSNIGGGYDDQEISNITLAWMMSQLEPFIDMRMAYVLEQASENSVYYRQQRRRERPWSFGFIDDSNKGVYALSKGAPRTPGCYYAVDPYNGRVSTRPLMNTSEYIHPSVRTRFMLNGPGMEDKGKYAPEALADWDLVIDYETPASDPDIYWRAMFPDRNVSTRILPESPLWWVERELCRLDPETYDYVREPPPTPPPNMAPPQRSRSMSRGWDDDNKGRGGGDRRSLVLRGRRDDDDDWSRDGGRDGGRDSGKDRARSRSRGGGGGGSSSSKKVAGHIGVD